MKRVSLIIITSIAAVTLGHTPAGQVGQTPPVATFKSSVDLVRVSATVRDRRGRFVQDLSARDFEVLDAGQPRRIADFRRDFAGVSVALLFDASGSMEGRLG